MCVCVCVRRAAGKVCPAQNDHLFTNTLCGYEPWTSRSNTKQALRVSHRCVLLKKDPLCRESLCVWCVFNLGMGGNVFPSTPTVSLLCAFMNNSQFIKLIILQFKSETILKVNLTPKYTSVSTGTLSMCVQINVWYIQVTNVGTTKS